VAQGVGLELKPQYHQKKKSKIMCLQEKQKKKIPEMSEWGKETHPQIKMVQ
jgi:hypothetical protein